MLQEGWWTASLVHPFQSDMPRGVESNVWSAMISASPSPISLEQIVEVLTAYHHAYSDLRMAPDESWEQRDAMARLADTYPIARSLLDRLSNKGEE
jgi:hypothetical protein